MITRIYKWIFHFYLCITSGLTSTIGPTTTRAQAFYWQNSPDAQEPLLRFPFAQFLANPCGIGSPQAATATVGRAAPIIHRSDVDDTEEQTVLRVLSNSESIEIQSRRFVSNFEDRYPHRWNITDDERNVIDRELYLVFQEARHLMGQIYSTTAVPNCQGVQLHSLSVGDPLSIWTPAGSIQGVALYRELVIATAHFHLMVRDIVDSGRYCLHESFIQRRLIHLLTGKLESMLCLILQSGSATTARFFAETSQFLPTMVYRYTECPSRQIRSCLVLSFTQQILDSIDHFFTNASRRVETSDHFRYHFLDN